MKIEDYLAEIKTFWNPKEDFPFGVEKNNDLVSKLENEFSRNFPESLKDYLFNFAPKERFYFNSVGNPIEIYGVNQLKFRQDGYNYNSVTNQEIEDWNSNYFILADEGADPIIIDLEEDSGTVCRFLHGQGDWETGETLADNIGQFLLCSALQHHALTNFTEDDPIIDDENGFNLIAESAQWYFPKMKKWAGNYYEEWCSIFDNS